MDLHKNRILITFSILLYLPKIVSHLDVDELKFFNYGIDVINEPVVVTEESPLSSVFLSSKYGQNYRCSYQNSIEDDAKRREEEDEAERMGIAQLLEPLATKPCLVHTKNWWTYQYCYKKHIKQYHVEDGKISGEVIYLGYYESEHDWDNTTNTKSNRHLKHKYHSQQYTNGTLCDLTGKERKAEVRFTCKTGDENYILRIDELETCSYIISIYTHHLCHHPSMKTTVLSKPVPITCQPLLTEQQFTKYQALKQEEEKQKKAASEKALIDKMLQEAALKAAADRNTEIDVESAMNRLHESLSADVKEEINAKIDEMDSLNIDKILSSVMKKTSEQTQSELEKNNEDKKDTSTLDEDETDEDISKQMKEIHESPSLQETLREKKEEISKSITEGFDDMIKSAQAELGTGEFENEQEKDAMVAQMTKTLEELLDSLTSESPAGQGESPSTESSSPNTESSSPNTESSSPNTESSSPSTESSSPSTESSSPSTESSSPKDPSSHIDPSTDDNGSEDKPTKSHNSKIKIKVAHLTQVKPGQASRDIRKEAVNLQGKQAEVLENQVQEELEKAGVDPEGRKIEVKIVTAGYYDENEDSIFLFSDEESSSLNKMIVQILGGDKGEKELEKQQRLEENYKFKWDDEEEDTP